MKDMAETLAREYTAGTTPEKLLALARHDTWLRSGGGSNSYSQYHGEKTERIEDELHSYLRSELRIVVDSFWEGRTSVELVVQGSSAELSGFFNGERPGRKVGANLLHDDVRNHNRIPYV